MSRIRILALIAVAATALLLAGCATSKTSDLSRDYADSATRGYSSSDGSLLVLPPTKRPAGPTWSATDNRGNPASSASLRGSVSVVNFWYAACPPCREEAPDLVDLYEKLQPKGVRFLGVNTRDGAATARTFEQKYAIPYPSVLDERDNTLQLAFAGDVSANTVPTTLVLDRQGRIAARFSGRITSVTTFTDVVNDVLEEATR